MFYYEKTMLSAYPLLQNYIEQLENIIKKRAKNSFYDYQDTVALSNKILELCDARQDLFMLKECTEIAFSKLKEEDKILIFYKYLGIMPSSTDFDHTSRNYFRKQVRAVEKFSKILNNLGFTEKWFNDNFMYMSFISNIYKKVILEDGKKHTFS